MKNPIQVFSVLNLLLLIGSASSCSTGPFARGDKGDDISQNGPTVDYARFDPTTVKMNTALQPLKRAEIIADVKDFNSKLTEVKAQFANVPVEVPMKNVGGSTWRGQLTTEQLQMLAVSGKTIRYDANILAKDDKGITVSTPNTFEVAIEAPELARNSG